MNAIWSNRDFAVTEYGLESIERGTCAYDIPANRLAEMRERYFAWPLHVAAKPWVDIESFLTAFELALIYHRRDYFSTARTATEARRIRKQITDDGRGRTGRFRFTNREELELVA